MTGDSEAERLGPLLHAMFASDGGARTDGQLLRQFVESRDEAAFAALLKRHGAMVLGVCRRILGNDADAEDAFQATFVVLVHKARSLMGRAVVGDWLHGVARRVALKARAAAARRRVKEQSAVHEKVLGESARNDWLPRLDDELARLPKSYRLPIVLCDLEGKTRQEAARQLGWPEGTVAGRLARARALLAKRLLRGVQVLSGTALLGNAARAGMPIRLFQSILQTSSLIVAGDKAAKSAASAAVLALAKGAIQAMFWSKIKIVALVLLAGVVLAGVGERTVRMIGAQEQKAVGKLPLRAEVEAAVSQKKDLPSIEQQDLDRIKEAKANVDAVEKLAAADRNKALEQVAAKQWEARWKEYLAGRTTAEVLAECSVPLLKAQLRLLDKKADIVAAYQAHLERIKPFEAIAKAKYLAGSIPITHYLPSVYIRLEAELWLEEAKAGKEPRVH